MTDLLARPPRPLDLTRLPLVGRFLRWRHARAALQLPLLLLAGLMVFDGLAGPQMAPKNLATTLTWVHYRGLVVIALLLVGNLFCMACPFMLVRGALRRLRKPSRMWPRALRNKWLATLLFVLLLFAYEYFDLWSTPYWTAWLTLAYFAGALMIDALFRGAAFCKYLCPLGQFNFISSLISPFEVQVASQSTCQVCRTKDCIKGQPGAGLNGCELWLFQQQKHGNMDCTFCLDCAHACPYGNVAVSTRLPGSELWVDPRRSGIGRFSRRPDLAVLIIVFCFGALLNAFAMVAPIYALEEWLARLLNTQSELLVLSLIFAVCLIAIPVALVGLAGWVSLRWSRSIAPFKEWVTRHTYALVPLAFSVWLAHYAFHFLTGFWTFVPIVQSFVADMSGLSLLGEPRWGLGPLVPAAWLYPLELGFLGLGLAGSLIVAYNLSARSDGQGNWRAFIPWAGLLFLLFIAAVWLMGQPMEMRGTFLVG